MDIQEKNAIYRLHAEFCKTLSDANRLLLISELSRGEASVNDLVARLELKQSNVSKHLAFMRERGIVSTRRDGATIFYSLTDKRISKAISLLMEAQGDLIAQRHTISYGMPELSKRQK